ncbi:ABC transporter ATP-binding protein [Paenibacillus sp. 1P07SE]|uniref:ABC transporter ATP-binding protein n=1 Tax=Paenibacillus sp. 1P07SE TaxID=3132209 RepID=UPI0039A40171
MRSNMKGPGTGRRLWNYAMLFKKPILVALTMLILAVGAELTGPFIAKRMIDQNILGIENRWFEVEAEMPYAVQRDGRWYKREDHFAPDEPRGQVVRILQAGRSFYWVEGDIRFDGAREGGAGSLSITSRDQRETALYEAEQLPRETLYAFYRPELPGFLLLAGMYFGMLIVAGIFSYWQRLLLQTSANRIVKRMRDDVFAHTQRLPVSYYDKLAAGQVVSRVTNDTEAIRELYVAVLANFFTAAVYMTGIYTALFILDARLALIALPLVPILIVWIIVYRRYAAHYNGVIRAKLSEINAMINESISGMPIIRAFRRQKEMTAEFEALNEHYYTYQNKLLNLNSITSHNLVNVVRNILFLVLIWMFWGDWLGTAISIGVLYAFVDYMNRMFQPIVGIVNQLSNLETARVSANRVFALMDEEGVEVDNRSIERYKGEVAFHDVSFAYTRDELVLRNISFTARSGETVALVGHTGSGKSSILNLLFRFYDIKHGAITVDGTDIRELSRQQLRQHMGIVLQDPFLYTGTIASNVSLDNPQISRERIEQALRDVGAYDAFMTLPQGIDTPVIEKGSTLSAGQRQLISFARALAYDPAILILDEATASIDTETEAVIQRALEVLKQGRTTFVIAHRLSTIRQAEQILVLDRGRIVEQGSHDRLMQSGGKYFAMYQLQQGAAVGVPG